jgi:membrane protease YdiL (CAAX protease family)
MNKKNNNQHLYFILSSRLILFFLFQLLFYFLLRFIGYEDSWRESQGWWMIGVLFTNIISIFLLILLFKKEGLSFGKVFRFTKKGWRKDLAISISLLIIAIPISVFPNLWISNLLWGSTEPALALLFRPLPLWAVAVSFLFPITQAFAELPTYFGYVMPRLKDQLNNGWIAWAITSFFLALQHIALPFIWDGRFLLWRLGMFLPFAFFLGLCLKIRPRLIPYFMVAHGILDVGTVMMIIS